MNIYDWDKIKEVGDCRKYLATVLGVPTVGAESATGWQHYAYPPWRPQSDSGGFSACASGWIDRAKNETGSILDLVARAEFNGDLWGAQAKLGEYYSIPVWEKARTRSKVVAEYIYTDLDGNPIHKKLRFEPKHFVQYHMAADGQWKPGMEGVIPLLYRLPDLAATKWVCVVGGEKDADNLHAIDVPATTNTNGEGEWQPHYNRHFVGKKVVIIPDNDDAGRNHAKIVAWNLRDVAKDIRVLYLPGLPPKGDVSDWLEAGGTKTALTALISGTDVLTDFQEPAPSLLEDAGRQSVAKKANAVPFANYRLVDVATAGGRIKQERQPVPIGQLIEDVNKRFWGFPRRVGGTMFDHDRKNGEIRFLEGAQQLFSWVQEKSGHPVLWAKIEGAVSQEQLFYSLQANSREYSMISGVPNWPDRDDVYYTCSELPEPTADAEYFRRFVDFFSPATATDRTLIEALIATPLYYRVKNDRPAWIIDSTVGQGVGKTKLAEMIAYLYGGEDLDCGEPFWSDASQVTNEQIMESVKKRLLSRSGRKKRIFLIDNLEGYFNSSSLASMITQGSFSGIAPYGKGEETRPNDITFIMTANSATVNRDLTSRSFLIMMKPPESPRPNWELDIQQFIQANRLAIISDIIGILKAGPQFEFVPCTRFRSWEREVLVPIMGTMERYSQAVKETADRRTISDGEAEEADMLRDFFISKLFDLGINAEAEPVFLQSKVLAAWARACIPGFGGRAGRACSQILRQMAKTGLIPELSPKIIKYPHHGPKRSRGMVWNVEEYAKGILPVRIVEEKDSGVPVQEDF